MVKLFNRPASIADTNLSSFAYDVEAASQPGFFLVAITVVKP